MTNFIKVDLSQVYQLEKDLKRLSDIDRNSVVTDALVSGAELMVFEVKKRVPVDTGKLKSNIFPSKVKKFQVGVFISGTNEAGTNSDTTMKKGDSRNSYYWRFVEYGTINQPPRPFLRTGFDANEAKVTDMIMKKIIYDVEVRFRAAA